MITTENIIKKEYYKIHKWLKKSFGNAQYCESKSCDGISKRYEWALIRGKNYEYNRENYMQLCSSCHRRYDFTKERCLKMSKSMKGKNSVLNQLQKSIIKKCYLNGITVPELANVFRCATPTISKTTRGERSNGLSLRKYNTRQINVIRSCHKHGLGYSEISRIFTGSDSDRTKIYRIVQNKTYV